jgi:hemoglobin
MRSLFRWWLAPLAACVLTLGLGDLGRAADEGHAGHEKGAEQKLYDLLRDVINEGVDLYTNRDYAGCYHFWQGSLRTLSPFLEQHGDWQKLIDGALAEARGTPVMWERDWILRRAMDKIRDDIHPPRKAEGATERLPAPAGPGPATRGPEPRPAGSEPPKAATLWDRLGGEKGVAKVVDDLCDVASKDPKVDFTRGGRYQPTKDDLAKFKKEMVDWVSSKTGGPFQYTGENMKKAHQGMKITDAQFDALAADLKSVLEKNGVKGDDQRAVLQTVESTRKDIVEKKADEEPEKKPEEKKDGEAKSGEKRPGEDKTSEGKKAEATVVGHVTYRGQPLPGTITLTAKDGTVASGAIDEDGAFKVEAVKPGSYKVTVKGSGDKDKDVRVPAKIPANYSDPRKTDLTVDVKEGKQTADFELKD